MRNRQAVVAAVAAAVVLSACGSDQPDAPPPAPPAGPTPAVASPTPTESAAERQRRLDFAAAEKSYRTFRKEYRRVVAAGGAREPTTVMKRTAGGPYLAALMSDVRLAKRVHVRQHGAEKIVYVQRLSQQSGQVRLRACEDGRKVTIFTAQKSYGDEGVRRVDVRVRKIGQSWKVWDGEATKVTSCG